MVKKLRRLMHLGFATTAFVTPSCEYPYTLDPCGPDRGRERIAADTAMIGWRVALSNEMPNRMAVVVAGGGDLSPQQIVGYQACRGDNGFKCKKTKYESFFSKGARWVSEDFSFNSQVQFARFSTQTESPLIVIASSYDGTKYYPNSSSRGAGIRYYDVNDKFNCKLIRNRDALEPKTLLKDISVGDFIAQDFNGDGWIDLAVASHGRRGRRGRKPEANISFVGLYFNNKSASQPFGDEPDKWFKVVRESDNAVAKPSRLEILDFNGDGWRDIAIGFTREMTTVWLGSESGYREPSNHELTLSGSDCDADARTPGGFWCIGNGHHMTADMTSVVKRDCQDDCVLLLETRGCYHGHTGEDCEKREGLYASSFKSRESRVLLESETGRPSFINTVRRGGQYEVLFGWFVDSIEGFDPQVKKMRLSVDGNGPSPKPTTVATGVFALDSSSFDREDAGPIRSYSKTMTSGCFLTLPESSWQSVEKIEFQGSEISKCGGSTRPCWDYPSGAWSPDPMLMVYSDSGCAGARAEVSYRPNVYYNQLLPSALPLDNAFVLGGATVLWKERPEG